MSFSLGIKICKNCNSPVSSNSIVCPRCGASMGVQPPTGGDELPSGMMLNGRFSIVKKLGQGGFGITYLAVDRSDGDKKVAIKELFIGDKCSRDAMSRVVSSPSVASDIEIFKRRFGKECKILKSLRHRNIVKITDVFDANNTSYFVMDYVDGISLSGVGPLSEQEALRIIWEVCNAMDYVHKKRINHLDIKPGNIMLRNGDNHVFLLDFGVSKNYDPKAQSENTSTIIGGTPGFSPIEQDNHGIKDFSPESDVYAIGATLYCLLTGKRPPNASDILNDGFDDSELKSAGVSKKTIDAIRKAMAPQRKNRTQTVNEFLNQLEAIHTAMAPQRKNRTQTVKKFQNQLEADSAGVVVIVPNEPEGMKKHWKVFLWSFVSLFLIAILGMALFLSNRRSSDGYSSSAYATYHVSTGYEFIRAIGSDRTIIVDNDILDLTECLERMAYNGEIHESSPNGSDYFEIDTCQAEPVTYTKEFDGQSINISQVSNMTIEGARKDTHIRVSASYVNVLGFWGCSGITLRNLKLGHWKESECMGDVIYAKNVNNLTVDNCSLYGSGVTGISAEMSQNIQVTNTHIYDCSDAALYFSNVDNATIDGCRFSDLPSGIIYFTGSRNIDFLDCNFDRPIDNFDYIVTNNGVNFHNCWGYR